MTTVDSGFFIFAGGTIKMRYKNRFIFLICLTVTGLIINSCKKDTQSSIHQLFTGNTWQLASVIRYNFVGDTLKTTDTLNTTCDTSQYFTFKADNTCTYTNFDCKPQPTATGKWSLSADQLFLMSDINCQIQDTSKVATSPTHTTQPFTIARISNLGQYSMILQTGDLATYYPPNQKRMYIIYGFVRVKVP